MQTEMHRSTVYAQAEQSRSKHRRILRKSSSCATHARPPIWPFDVWPLPLDPLLLCAIIASGDTSEIQAVSLKPRSARDASPQMCLTVLFCLDCALLRVKWPWAQFMPFRISQLRDANFVNPLF